MAKRRCISNEEFEDERAAAVSAGRCTMLRVSVRWIGVVVGALLLGMGVGFADPFSEDGICGQRGGEFTSSRQFLTYMHVWNPCEDHQIYISIFGGDGEFTFDCHSLFLVQPPGPSTDDTKVAKYVGHGYEAGSTHDHYHFVTLHQPGNTGGICRRTRREGNLVFWASTHPARVDNPALFDFREPFEIHYRSDYDIGMGEDTVVVSFTHDEEQ